MEEDLSLEKAAACLSQTPLFHVFSEPGIFWADFFPALCLHLQTIKRDLPQSFLASDEHLPSAHHVFSGKRAKQCWFIQGCRLQEQLFLKSGVYAREEGIAGSCQLICSKLTLYIVTAKDLGGNA